jgi:hypothetical protein
MPAEPPDGRKVKSGTAGAGEATDRHERAQDYLSSTPGSTQECRACRKVFAARFVRKLRSAEPVSTQL